MVNITIIMPVSRETYLKRIFAQLELLECDREFTNLITLVDGDQRLLDLCARLTDGSKFKHRLCVKTQLKGKSNPGSVKIRRERIAKLHNEFKQYIQKIPTNYIFCLEDDTLFPTYTLDRLMQGFNNHPFAGFITGLELGRWGWTSVGVYRANDVYDTTELISLSPDEVARAGNNIALGDPRVAVDAAGLYGCLIKKDNYLGHEFKVFADGMLGPDVDFGISMRRQGLLNYADLRLKFTHLTPKENIDFQSATVVQVRVTKNEQGKWEYGVI